jgi:hypothetical protein
MKGTASTKKARAVKINHMTAVELLIAKYKPLL